MTSTITPLLIGGLGGMELLIILAVLVLLFGASKLPELARGSGQALKIFKAETKGLIDSDDKADKTTKTARPRPRRAVAETTEPGRRPRSGPRRHPRRRAHLEVVETPHEHGATRA